MQTHKNEDNVPENQLKSFEKGIITLPSYSGKSFIRRRVVAMRVVRVVRVMRGVVRLVMVKMMMAVVVLACDCWTGTHIRSFLKHPSDE